MNNKLKNEEKIKKLETKIRHLENQYKVVKQQCEKTTEDYFKVLNDVSNADEQLQQEIAELKKMKRAPRKAHDDLEIRVKEQTAELAKANEELQKEIIGRNQAKETLEKIEERLRNFMKSSPDSFALLDSKLNYVEVNKAGLKAFDKTREEIIGKNVLDIAPELKETDRYDKYLEVIKTGKSFFINDLVPHPRFGDIHLSVRAFKVGDGLGVIVTDITEQKRTEEALKKAHDELEIRVQERTSELLKVNEKLQNEITERNKEEQEKERLLHDLGERVKELNCLYGLSKIVDQPGITLEEIFEKIVYIIPPGWCYPDITCARVIFENKEYTTDNFTTPEWKQSADIIIHGKKVGAIEVYYLEEKPELDEGPFLKEEIDLIKALAGRLGEIIETNQVEEALRESEKLYKMLVRTSPDSVVVTDLEGQITYVSQRTLELHGYESAEELLGKSAFELIAPEDHEMAMINLQKTLKEGSVRNAVYTLVRKDKTHFIGELNSTLIKDTLGKPKAFIATIRDITEREKAERALKETNQLLDTILNNTPMLVAYLDPHFNFIKVNRAYAEADEREPSFFPGKNHFDMYPNTENEEMFRRVVVTGEPYFIYAKPFEYAEHPEREVTYWNWSLIPIKNPEGILTGLVLTIANVTDQIQMGKELVEQKEFIETAINAQLDTFFVFDPSNGKPFLWNKAFNEISGYTDEEIASMKAPDDWYDKDDLKRVAETTEKILKEDSGKVEMSLITKDGKSIPTEYYASLIRDNNNKPKYIIAIGRDITERRKAEKALRKAHDKLEIRVRERTAELAKANVQLHSLTEHLHEVREKERTFIAREIHDELGQALTALKMEVSWIERNLPKELDLPHKKIKSMSKFIDKTIKTTKDIITELRPTLLDDFGLEATIEWYANEFQNRTEINCEIHTDLKKSAIDQNRSLAIFRIFQETLTNVARHANATRVKVNIIEDNGNLVLRIEDNGKGITEEQINDSKSFGLIGMKERLILLRGKLKISGFKNKGTIIIATIPLERREVSR